MTNGTADPAALSATASPRRSSYRSSEEVRRFWPAAGQIDWFDARLLARAIRSAGPPLLFGVRLWASVSLALHVAFWLELDNAFWAGTSAALVCQPHLGASLRKGWFLMIGTVVGAVAIVVLNACFPQARGPVSRRSGAVGRAPARWSPRCCATSWICGGAGRLHGRDHRRRHARRDRRHGRAGVHARHHPRDRGLHRHRVRRHRSRRHRSRRRPAPAGGVVRGALGRNHGPIYRHLGAGRAGHAGDAAGSTRAHRAGHCARSGHRRGDRRVLPTPLSFAGAADGRGRLVRRSGRLAHGRGAPGAAAGRSRSGRGGGHPAQRAAGAALGAGAR